MTDFRHMYGAVYIFENLEAQRVKVGMTINATNKITDRLKDVNAIWLGQKAMCQICGTRRFINDQGLIPKHVVSGKKCPGGNSLPIEKDTIQSVSYLEEIKERYSNFSGSEKGSFTRIINNLEKRIEKYRHKSNPVGTWELRVAYYTDCAEEVELLSHKILDDSLDHQAPLGEIFCCSVSEATKVVEQALSQLDLLDSARKETQGSENHTLNKDFSEYQEREKKPAKYECAMCHSQWEGVEPGTNPCPKCGTHLYSKFLAYVFDV